MINCVCVVVMLRIKISQMTMLLFHALRTIGKLRCVEVVSQCLELHVTEHFSEMGCALHVLLERPQRIGIYGLVISYFLELRNPRFSRFKFYVWKKILWIKIKDGNPSIKSTRQMKTQLHTTQRKNKSKQVKSLPCTKRTHDYEMTINNNKEHLRQKKSCLCATNWLVMEEVH